MTIVNSLPAGAAAIMDAWELNHIRFAEAALLHSRWERLTEQVTVTMTDFAAMMHDEAEQEAYDELVDYLEAHDLNCSKYDPRTGCPECGKDSHQ